MAKEEDDDNLPDKDAAKGFYAKYEPKEIIGRCVLSLIFRSFGLSLGSIVTFLCFLPIF